MSHFYCPGILGVVGIGRICWASPNLECHVGTPSACPWHLPVLSPRTPWKRKPADRLVLAHLHCSLLSSLLVAPLLRRASSNLPGVHEKDEMLLFHSISNRSGVPAEKIFENVPQELYPLLEVSCILERLLGLWFSGLTSSCHFL